MTARSYPVTEPHLDERDRHNFIDAFDSGWISSQGPYLQKFEQAFADYVGQRHGLAVCNGTAALHVALLALGVKPGDEVIVPTFTFVATANAVRYCGAEPVFVDCEADTWNIDPARIAEAITARTVGIVPVHLYGHPCDMAAIQQIAEAHGLWVVEDAAEAHGAEIEGQRVGSFGQIATFSLYGNKIITTGEGGVIVTDDAELAARMRLLRGQGMDPERRYWFETVGFNYRMTNPAAALGCSQLQKVDFLIARHREIAKWYREELGREGGLVLPTERPGTRNVQWLSSVRLRSAESEPALRDELMARLQRDGIETRPFFYPMHALPIYRRSGSWPVADRIARSGINLPSSPRLERSDVAYIAERVREHARALERIPGPLPRAKATVKGAR